MSHEVWIATRGVKCDQNQIMDWPVNVALLLITVVLITQTSIFQLGSIIDLERTQTPVRELQTNVSP
jgi:hypothetical protein